MSITDRLSLVHRQRGSGSLNSTAPDEMWSRRQTTPFSRGTGSLSFSGETAFDQLSRELALDSQTLALILGMTDLMLERWQRGMVQPTSSSLQQLERVKGLHRRLYTMFQPFQVLDWLRTPNEHLYYQAPLDVLIRGDVHKVEAALDHLEETGR